MIGEDKNQGFEPKGTKISPAMAVVWDAVCEALGTNTYDLIQQFIYAMIRAASEQHDKSPEIQKLLDTLEASQVSQANLIPQTEELLSSYDDMTNEERNELLKEILEKIEYYKGADGQIVIDLYPRLPKI